MQEEVIVGLDIGTTKICSVVGEMSGGKTNIIGIGTNPSIGLRKGVVVNIESTVESIKKAVEEAELMAGCEISSVYAGIAGGHITGFNSRGIVAVKGSEISEQDVDRVIDAARAVAIPMDREVIHVLPQEFMVDDERGIQNPVGMSGVRLEAKIHIVTGAVASAHNIVKCANRSGLDVCDIVLESLASGEAVLTDEEKELGVALLDLGGGSGLDSFAIGPLGVRIGRSAPADVVLADPRISRAHCEVALADGEVIVSDLDSTNGTFVDDQRVDGTAPLPVGSILQVGGIRLVHEVRAPAGAN